MAYYLYKILNSSYSLNITNKFVYNDLKKTGKGIIFAVWHCFFYSFVSTHKYMNISTIVSQSKDGDLGAFLLSKLGFISVRGSSSRGGIKALLQTKNYIDRGYDAVIAVDGPLGPRFDVKPGAIYLAKLSNIIILPVIFNVGIYKAFNSWDRFILPLPFTHVTAIYGTPLILSTSRNKEVIYEEQKKLKNELMLLTVKYAKNIL